MFAEAGPSRFGPLTAKVHASVAPGGMASMRIHDRPVCSGVHGDVGEESTCLSGAGRFGRGARIFLRFKQAGALAPVAGPMMS